MRSSVSVPGILLEVCWQESPEGLQAGKKAGYGPTKKMVGNLCAGSVRSKICDLTCPCLKDTLQRLGGQVLAKHKRYSFEHNKATLVMTSRKYSQEMGHQSELHRNKGVAGPHAEHPCLYWYVGSFFQARETLVFMRNAETLVFPMHLRQRS